MFTARIKFNTSDIIGKIDDRLYGSFIEHMGRAVYTGIYQPDHPTADADGFRQDVIDLVKPLKLSVVRYPGGNFLSGYRWEDGVGDKAKRPVRPDLAWEALEPNLVGIDEFYEWSKKVGTEIILGVNLGTRGPQDALNLLEYCNVEGGTYYSDMRRANGHEKPFGIKLWCLGNEMDGPWQICSKTADEYARLAAETGRLMKILDPSIEVVACGSSYYDMPSFGDWERAIMQYGYDVVDYISLHQYFEHKGNTAEYLASTSVMVDFIEDVEAICDDCKKAMGKDKQIYISFDEYNAWYHWKQSGQQSKKWTVGRALEEEDYTFTDALLVGSLMTILINHSDWVKIGCLAQLVNTIAPIMTDPNGGAWTNTIYIPFLFASRYGRGEALGNINDSPDYTVGKYRAQYVDCAGVRNEDGTLTFFMVNKSLAETASVELSMRGFGRRKLLSCEMLTGCNLNAVNKPPYEPVQVLSAPEIVTPLNNGSIVQLPPASWACVRFEELEYDKIADKYFNDSDAKVASYVNRRPSRYSDVL